MGDDDNARLTDPLQRLKLPDSRHNVRRRMISAFTLFIIQCFPIYRVKYFHRQWYRKSSAITNAMAEKHYRLSYQASLNLKKEEGFPEELLYVIQKLERKLILNSPQ